MERARRSSNTSNRSILWVPVIFSTATITLFVLSKGLGKLQTSHQSYYLKFPTSIQDISEMASFLVSVRDSHLAYLVLVFSAGYLYKQTFAIPGSVFMNVLAGALFGPALGFLITCLLSALGATNCYLLSQTFGRSYVSYYFPDKVRYFQEQVEDNRDSLWWFLLFFRLFPMAPGWALNVVAPLVGIPLHVFFITAFIGLMPYNFICVQTGDVLSQITSVSDVFTAGTMFKMSLVAFVALLPGLYFKRDHNSPR